MKVRISKKGYAILANRQAADSLMRAIIENGSRLMAGESVEFDFISKSHPGEITKGKVQVAFKAA